MQQPKYTAEQWDEFKDAFRGLNIGTVELARAVLVDGVRPSDLAKKTGDSRQLVYAAVKRVRGILQQHDAEELVPVMVWLPPELAEKVRQMAAPYDQPKSK
ncbi:Uncharacterised protein [Pseudomonas fluorescens]|uniref:TrfB transcriptional repressor protein domain-containing protein n=3 Tax=Pseudomonas TaxID=286 RepID=A0A9W6KAZ6_9PSED|nr:MULTISPECIES: TrfB-related DNA-binding protein [Pseudomonas]AIG04675.1 regulatory protein [Pseudomonas fluorescens]MRU53410.1 hypothetical protein [Pseudomonas gessardii]NNA70822.1 hypothetical protein [Pseudomonas gessardii]NNA98181.1 hypothetical protein [Pseudomonas gessardii]ONH38576.1 hypothetical protein BLL38_23625 [Pseudomonas gessardii]